MLWIRAPAKLNLTLRVVKRRADGYHELESLVAFAGLCDWLGFEPGDDLLLEVLGPWAREVGPEHENLVVRAARLLASQIPGLRLGRFRLIKRLPAAAGLGGGSADAAAAQAFWSNPNNRFGVSASITNSAGSNETFSIADSSALSIVAVAKQRRAQLISN